MVRGADVSAANDFMKSPFYIFMVDKLKWPHTGLGSPHASKAIEIINQLLCCDLDITLIL